ncbi:hypothetical protein [Candidatus Uabimicrobium sp. HlEnr_7]|uniref:hypothetical protein n=1 Tax=Candidatus Uabimicrobium helgolandensis TaxID=3095367 RepID=UPI003557E63D
MKYILVSLLFLSALYAQEVKETVEEKQQSVVVIMTPANAFTKSKVLLQVEGKAEAVEFLCDGQKIGEGILSEEKWQCEWDSVLVDDGAHELTATLLNKEQKTISEVLVCKVDNNAPEIVASAKQISTDQGQITLSVKDQFEYSIHLKINDEVQTYNSGSPFTWTIQTGESYVIDIEAVDTAENVSQKQITLETKAEEITLEILQSFPPTSNDEVVCKIKTNAANIVCYLSDNPDVRADVEDKGDHYEISWRPEDDGLYTLTLLLESENGQAKEEEFAIRIDTNPPQITISENESITNKNLIVIDAKIEDSSAIESAVLYDGDKQIANLQNKDNKWQWQGTISEEGVHSLHVVSKDVLGNEGKSNIRKFIFDNTPPVVKNIQITPQELQIGIVSIVATYEDSISGISQNVTPKIYIESTSHVFEIIEHKDKNCSAELLITEDFSAGDYSVYMENLQDLAGNVMSKTLLGTIKIIEKSQGVGNWPLLPQSEIPEITFNTAEKSLLIKGSAQQSVVSIEDGVIVAIQSCMDEPGFIIVQNVRGKQAWGYYNVSAQKHPAEKRYWALGDAVKKGDPIAKIAKDKSLQLKLLVKKDKSWVAEKSIVEALQPQAKEYVTTAAVFTYPRPKYGYSQKMQTSDWLLVSYIMLLSILIFVFITPKKVKA